MKTPNRVSRIPVALFSRGPAHFIRWVHRGRRTLKAPFFDNNFSNDLDHQVYTDLLSDFSHVKGQQPIAGFIFHSGRCGSTLLVRMLMSLSECLVISEPTLVNQFLLESKRLPRHERVQTLRMLLLSFSQIRTSREKKVFFKLTSFNALDADLFLEAFPEIPWIYLTRDPIYTLSSQLLRPSRWSATAKAILSTGGPTSENQQPNPWTKENLLSQQRILTKSFRLVNSLRSNGRGLIFQYHQIKNGIPKELQNHFNLCISSFQKAKLQKVLKLDAKSQKPTAFDPLTEKQKTPQIHPSFLPGYSVLMKTYRQMIQSSEVRKS